MWQLGYDAILVGEALVTAEEPEQLIRRLVAG
jgi:indole-3-glycerol phosphate synthase